ncbi:adenylosuccinate lyase, partial [Streptomyces sp. NPDC002491]
TTLRRRLRPHDPHRRVALACVEGLGALGDDRARAVLNDALAHPVLAEAAVHALARSPGLR